MQPRFSPKYVLTRVSDEYTVQIFLEGDLGVLEELLTTKLNMQKLETEHESQLKLSREFKGCNLEFHSHTKDGGKLLLTTDDVNLTLRAFVPMNTDQTKLRSFMDGLRKNKYDKCTEEMRKITYSLFSELHVAIEEYLS